MKVDKEHVLIGEVNIYKSDAEKYTGVSIGTDARVRFSGVYELCDRAHAQLFADALEAFNRTGLTPSELADKAERAEWDLLRIHAKADSFVLPEKWALKCETEEQAEEFLPWVDANKQTNAPLSTYEDRLPTTESYFVYPEIDGGHLSEPIVPKGYTEITFEQFKQHVLKQEPEVKDQPAELPGVTDFPVINYSVAGQYFISPLNNVVVNDGKHTATHFAGTVVKTGGSTYVGAYSDTYPKDMWQPYTGEPILHTQEQRFEAVVAARLEAIRGLILVKGREYRRNGNVFHNFNAGGKMLGCTPERALLGFAAKHFVSVVDLVNDLDSGKVPTEAVVNEKLGDAMVYLVLLEGLFKERLNTL